MFHVKQYKMFHVKQCKINVPRETMHKGSSLGGRGQRRASAAAFRFGRRGFGCFGLRRQLSASVGAASAASGFVGRGSLQLFGLRLLSAPGLARLRSAVGSFALLRPPPPSFASPSQSLRLPPPSSLPLNRAAPPSAASATASLRFKQPPPPFAASATASLRYKQPPPPSAASATASLRYKQPPPLLPPAAQAAAFVHCFTWNIYFALFHVEHFALFHVKHYRILQIVPRETL